MKILITGGTGYLGYGIARELIRIRPDIEELVIYDNLSSRKYDFFTGSSLPTDRVRFVQGDILDGRKLEKTLQGIDWVYHLAAKVTTPFADRESHFYDQINHWGSAQLAQCIERSNVEGIIYLSSASVYGDGAEEVNETYDPHPNSFYGISKHDGEKQMRRLKENVKTYIIRSANIYGFNQAFRIDAVVNRFMFEAHFNGRISIHGPGDQMRSFIHIDKASHVLARLVGSEVEPNTYNLGEHNLSILEVAQSVNAVYPDLEMLNINHQMKMKNQSIELPIKLSRLIPWPEKSLHQELTDFKKAFAF